MSKQINKISIVILNYNGEELLPQTLPSITKAAKRSSIPCEVIILDNQSTDNSFNYVKNNFKDVRMEIASGNNFLFSYNELIPKLDGDIVILFNEDIKVDDNFIDPLINYFKNDNVFAVIPKQMDFEGKSIIGGPKIGKIKWGRFVTEKMNKIDCPRFALYGFNGAFHRKKLLKLGGFDNLVRPSTWEDVDICYRAWKKGWSTIYEPNSVIYHDESHTMNREIRKKKLRSQRVISKRNSVLFLWKNIHDPLMIANHILLQIPRLLYSLLYERSYISAFFESLLRLPEALRKRKAEKYKGKLSDKDVLELVKSEKLDLDKLQRKPKIGIVTTWYRKGVSYQSRFMAKQLSEANDVYIFAYKGYIKDEENWLYKKLEYHKNISPRKVINWIKKEKLDAVFFPDRLEDEKVLDWCLNNDVATIDDINYETIKKENFDLYRKLTMLHCPVKCTCDLLSKHGFQNVKFVRWGINTSIYSPSKNQIESTIRFIHNAGFGGSGWRKNTEAVVLAFDKASKQNNDIQLILKSQKPISEYPKSVQDIVCSNPQIIVNDKDLILNDLLELYRSCHVSILPSKWEGIGLPFIESLSLGQPIITVDAPPMNEWVNNGYNGICAKVEKWEQMKDPELLIKAAYADVDDLTKAILELSNIDKIKKMRDNAINSVKGNEKRFTDGINNIIKELIT